MVIVYRRTMGFPRFYAAASLKRVRQAIFKRSLKVFSAVLCRGLIEAATVHAHPAPAIEVFRGFMPRPH